MNDSSNSLTLPTVLPAMQPTVGLIDFNLVMPPTLIITAAFKLKSCFLDLLSYPNSTSCFVLQVLTCLEESALS